MIIKDFYVMGIAAFPNEADTPLIVNSNAMLPRSIAFQFFKPVRGRDTQRFQLTSRR